MRAVQRSVFPGGSPTFFEGEIAPDNTPGERSRTNAQVIDLTARVDALESQLQTLTGQTEQNAYHLQIGRVSCREKVCLRVAFGGCRIIKKKTNTYNTTM